MNAPECNGTAGGRSDSMGMVKTAALALAAALLPVAAQAKCAYYTSWTFPEAGATLPTNGRIVLDGYGALQPVIAEIEARRPELRSATERVALRVVTIHKGQFNLTQVVLAPVRELRPRTRYELHLELRKDDKPVVRFDGGKEAAYSWTTGPGPDQAVPEWAGAPRATGGKFAQLGCGPEAEAFIASAASDPSGVIFLARVVPAGGGEAVEYLLPAREGTLKVGHGMCSGPFQLTGGAQYEVTLTAVDAAGNASAAPGPPVKIVGPAPKDGEY